MRIESFMLEGPVGQLECQLKLPADERAAPGTAVVCHPHPVFGGTMHNKVVHAVANALAGAGLPVMRFNFRGAGLSAGGHDHGRGEQEDLRVVLDYLASRYAGLPLMVSGYSFGSFVGLKVGCGDPRVAALIAVGLPASLYDFSFLARCDIPLTIIQGEQDPFGPLPLVMALGAIVATAAAGREASSSPARVVPVAGAGHDFAGHLDEVARRVLEAIPFDLGPIS